MPTDNIAVFTKPNRLRSCQDDRPDRHAQQRRSRLAKRRIIGERTRVALAAAKAGGVKLGGTNRQSIENREAARARAEKLRPVLAELAALSDNAAAAESSRTRDCSMNCAGEQHLWRKNRNPTYSRGDSKKIGVDINRNYDFLWNFKKYFHPAAWTSSLASDNPAIETYHGPAPFSEPEIRNVRWLIDKSHPILFLDLHSYDGDVLYTWGNDENQTTDPCQNVLNRAYNKKRGRIGDTYREYLSLEDYETATGVALAVSDAMRDVRNKHYKPLQAVGLYPTCGTSGDYAFSRHLVHPGLTKTFAFTLEFNFEGTGKDPFLATADPETLRKTMLDVIPGLIALSLAVPENRRSRGKSTHGSMPRLSRACQDH